MKTNIINEKEKINQFLSRLRLESRKLVVRSELVETNGMVVEIHEDYFDFLYQGNFKPSSKMVNIQFMIGGDYYFGYVPIIKNVNKTLSLGLPEELENRSIRKYPRTSVNNEIFAKFNIIANVSVEKEINTASAPRKLAKIYFELQKNVPDIKKVLNMIGNEITDIADKSEIKIHKKNEKYTEEIDFVIKYKLPFWISETEDAKNFIKEIPSNDVVNFSSYLKEMKKIGWQDSKIKEEIVKRQKNYIEKEIYSIAIVPVKLYDNVIGHISALTYYKTKRMLRLNDVYYLKALADVISEALAKAKLFKLDTGSEYEIPVMNISAGGTYLEVNSQYIIKFLHEGMHLKTGLKFPDRVVDVICQIRRIDFLGQKVRLALKFIEISAKDQDFIENHVRDRIDFNKIHKHST